MNRIPGLHAAVLASSIAMLGLALCDPGSAWAAGAAEASSYDAISQDLQPLREAFNAEPSHVRAILLASPT